MWRFTGMVHVWCVAIPCDECWCMDVDEWMMSVDAWMLMNDCWWMNDECWWMNGEWMLIDEWWTNMSVDACWWMWDVCWMMYDALMHLWCVMHWCMLNRWMCVKYMYIFCNHNYVLYWFCNCFNVLILIFVFVCLSGFLYVSCTCNKTVTPYDGVCLHPHTHEPVTLIKKKIAIQRDQETFTGFGAICLSHV